MKSICRNRELEIMSRGLVVLFPEPINPKVTAILKGDGLVPAKSETRELSKEDLVPKTLVLAMTSREKKRIRELLGPEAEVWTLGEYAGQDSEVEEPHGGTLANYGACYEYIDFLVKVTFERLFYSEDMV